ncbi:MAG: VWA domain-containing protein [Deltaproteobacteria bacterium]|nr:VWA domain-containing protein [Deltaproteobacteria bacterium]MDQ3297813.1 VWA domain-containing protein [Myxococcota bacterium]
MKNLTVAFVALLTTACTASTYEGETGETAPDAGDTGGGGGGPDASCPAVMFTATSITPSIQLLIDRSGSMNEAIGATTRYSAVRSALVDQTNGVVSKLQGKAYFGASLYSTDTPCPTLYSVPRTLNNRDSIATLINSQSPGGNTPTGGSIDKVVADFAANPPPANSPPLIVLATDGLPNNCDGNATAGQQKAIQAATASYAAGIRLFILAVGNGIADNHLQSMANAGAGVQAGQTNAPYYVANSAQDLTNAFNQIIGGVLSCELMINGNVDEAQAMGGTVVLNGMTLTYGTEWTLATPNTIKLLGAACEALKASTNPTVTASFPCGAVLL